jgi:hypothetical protein
MLLLEICSAMVQCTFYVPPDGSPQKLSNEWLLQIMYFGPISLLSLWQNLPLDLTVK